MSSFRRDLSGRIALVTGAARRLGRHLALSLGRAGADVVLHYNSRADEAEEVAETIRGEGRRVWTIAADFTRPTAAEELAAEALRVAGRLDILVNNVGNYVPRPLLETSAEEWRQVLETNLIAPHVLIRAFAAQEGLTAGQILNVGYAGLESIRPHPTATPYQVSKTGLFILTKTCAEILAPRNIRVNMISPGHLDNSIDLPDDVPAEIPLGRAGSLVDIEDALHYLLDFEGYVTGVNLDVAGGYRL